MNDLQHQHGSRDWGTLIVSGLFVLVGAVTLYDTSNYVDIDSIVFPRSVAIGLIVISIVTIIWMMVRPSAARPADDGVWWRRVLLVTTMLAACGAMPYVGFVPAVAIAFIGGLIAAMHDRWTVKTAVVFALSGAIVVAGFYALFRYALHVPLP